METNVTPSAHLIIKTLESLRKGKTVVYYTGRSGWLGGAGFAPLLNWVEEANYTGAYDFTQKRLGGGIYEYRARRRYVPDPMYDV